MTNMQNPSPPAVQSKTKYRLVTRSDFDGLVCAVLLKHMDMLDDILFVHPKDMQDGKVPITDKDITTNLPYLDGVHLAFDHHSSEMTRNKEQKQNHIIDPKAMSAARVVYDHYGGLKTFPARWNDMMHEVDKADAAQFSKEEILKEPNTIEFQQVWDPLGLATLGGDETLAWFRHSEVKHGRVAMAAFVGWWAVAAGATLPGDLTYGVPFSSLPKEGLAAWDAVPGWGKAQMLMFAGLIEFHDEIFFSRRSTHYLKGGIPGKNMVPGLYDPLGFSANKSEEAKARGRSVEIKNGRLAMLAMAALYCEAKIPGSVPFQPDC